MDKKDWASLFEAPPEATAASKDREVLAYVEQSWEQPTKKLTVTLHNLRIKYGKLVLLDEAEDCEEEEGAEAEELVTRQVEQVK